MSRPMIEIINDDFGDDSCPMTDDADSMCIDISSEDGDSEKIVCNKFALTSDKISDHIPQYNNVEEFRMDPLCMLIKYVITDATMKKEVITRLDKQLLRKILKLFTSHYPENILCLKKKNKMYLNYEIDTNCLIKFIQVWKGWKNYNFKNVIRKDAYDDLYCYLRDSLSNAQKYKEKYSLKELEAYSQYQENIVYLSCSLKQLKQSFYYEPVKFNKSYQMESNTDLATYCVFDVPSKCLFNWPYICTQLKFEDFSMIHQNVNYDEYHLINYTAKFKPDIQRQDTNLYFQPSLSDQTFRTNFIYAYFEQLKRIIQTAETISRLRKKELTETIIEFQEDLSSLSLHVQTNKHYYKNLNLYPYVRYLGFPSEGGVCNETYLLMENQKKIGQSDVNVRVMNTCYPRVSFILEKFQVVYKIINNKLTFFFNPDILNSLETCLTYKCTVCDSGNCEFTNHYAVSIHLMEFHGVDMDWECVNCKKSFNTKLLSLHRWSHNCTL